MDPKKTTPKVSSSANAVPTSAKAKFKPLTSAKRARKRLLERHGWKDDELDTTFKTEEELLKFYNDIARAEFDKKTEDDLGWDSEDAMDAPAEEKARLADKRKGAQREKFDAVNSQPAAVSPDGEPINVPATPAVSFDEFLQAGDDLKALTEEIAEEEESDDRKKK